MIKLGKSWDEMTRDELIQEGVKLFDEREFWKASAIEKGVPINSYKVTCNNVEQMFYELNPDNTGVFYG